MSRRPDRSFLKSHSFGVSRKLCQTKVQNFCLIAIRDKNICGLDITMNDAALMGCIQPVGAAPGAYTETSSYNYGVGAFLLAASEVSKLPTAGGHYAQRAPTHLNP